MLLLRPALSFALCLLFFPIAEAFECESSVSESGIERVTVATGPDAAPPHVMIVYLRNGIVAVYAIGGAFLLDDWKFLGDEAYDIDGKRFDEVVARQEMTAGEGVIETVQITVGWQYLEEHASTGIDVTIYGEKGDLDLFIAPEMISAFFSCLEPSM